MNLSIITSFIFTAIRVATPLIYGALAVCITKQAGLLNMATESMMLSGALCGVLASGYTQSLVLGVLGGILIVVQAVDQAAGKRVATAHAVDDVPNFVLFRHIEVLAVIQARRPAVPVRAVALAQRDGDALHVRIAFQDLIAERAVFLAVQLAGFNVHIDRIVTYDVVIFVRPQNLIRAARQLIGWFPFLRKLSRQAVKQGQP